MVQLLEELPILVDNPLGGENEQSLIFLLQKGNSSRSFNVVSTAECECCDGLQTEEHVFWDC
jgi:hypothetical protein